MKPVHFAQANLTLTRPPGMTEDECGECPVYRGPDYLVSRWKMTWRERLQVLLSGSVWLWVYGHRSPPVLLSSEDPWPEQRSGEPTWLLRMLRRAWGCCPWCGVRMRRDVLIRWGLFLNHGDACPRGHFARWIDIGSYGATFVVQDGGRVCCNVGEVSLTGGGR